MFPAVACSIAIQIEQAIQGGSYHNHDGLAFGLSNGTRYQIDTSLGLKAFRPKTNVKG